MSLPEEKPVDPTAKEETPQAVDSTESATEAPATEELAEVEADLELGKGMCGIVMPMSTKDGYTAEHWQHMLAIIEDAAKDAGYKPRIVAASDETGILQQNIIRNLYQYEIVVCDLSSRNSNVMLELGLRIAFNMPFVLIIDEDTPISSDIGNILQERYKRGMLYPEVRAFKTLLTNKIKSTVAASNRTDYQSLLDTFKIKKLKAGSLEAQELDVRELLDDLLARINKAIQPENKAIRGLPISEVAKTPLQRLKDQVVAYLAVNGLPHYQEMYLTSFRNMDRHTFFSDRIFTKMWSGYQYREVINEINALSVVDRTRLISAILEEVYEDIKNADPDVYPDPKKLYTAREIALGDNPVIPYNSADTRALTKKLLQKLNVYSRPQYEVVKQYIHAYVMSSVKLMPLRMPGPGPSQSDIIRSIDAGAAEYYDAIEAKRSASGNTE